MKNLALFLLALAAASPSPAQTMTPNPMPYTIDAGFPGGNILVEKVEGDTVRLKPELKGTAQPWFYWYFRVTGAAGRTLTFVFDKSVMGVRGPAVSLDGGRTWKWLGAEAVKDGAFSFAFPPGAADVRFSVGMPYLRADFERFLARHKDHPFLQVETLAKTPKGRDVVMVKVGAKDKKAPFAIAVTARHHCCEMMASYILEGILEGALADDATGRWLRENAEFLFVPFMDTDGVENGDQGKGRAPHDHNRDYIDQPLYAEVRALREKLPAWSAGRPLVFLDLHDPALKTDIHESICFLEPEQRDQAQRLEELTTWLERDQQGPIIYSKQTTMRFGTGFNGRTPGISAGWARSLPNTILGCTIETAYANAGGCEVNADSAREFGRDLAVALRNLLGSQVGAPAQKASPQASSGRPQAPFQVHRWQKDPRNPVLPPGGAPFDVSCCMNPFVLRQGNEYWLFYAGGDAEGHRRICLAVAPVDDLTRWKRVGPLFDLGKPGAFDAHWCVLPCVQRVGDKWHLYYTGRSGDTGAGLQEFPGIGLATSDDLLHWKKFSEEPVLLGDGFPEWTGNRGIAGGARIMEIPQADGRTLYRLYYTLATGTPSKVLQVDQAKQSVVAHSWDGIRWFDKRVVLRPRPEADYENAGVIALNAWKTKAGYRAIYAGIGTRFGAYSICEATSADGLAWERGEPGQNLSLPPSGSGWESKMTEYPSVIEENGRLRLFYCGNGYGKTGIGTALADLLP